jgi:hypothetical protein
MPRKAPKNRDNVEEFFPPILLGAFPALRAGNRAMRGSAAAPAAALCTAAAPRPSYPLRVPCPPHPPAKPAAFPSVKRSQPLPPQRTKARVSRTAQNSGPAESSARVSRKTLRRPKIPLFSSLSPRGIFIAPKRAHSLPYSGQTRGCPGG